MANELNYKGPRGGGKPTIKSSQILDVTYNSGTSKQVTIDSVNPDQAIALFEVYDSDGQVQGRLLTYIYEFINSTTLEFEWGADITGNGLVFKVIITIIEFEENVNVQKGTSVWTAGEISAKEKLIDITAVNLDTSLVFQSTLVDYTGDLYARIITAVDFLDSDTIRIRNLQIDDKTTSWAVVDYGS